MKKDLHFWFATLVRGFVALITGSMILVVPDMARTLLLLPMAVTVAILGLAAYGVLDSVLIFVSSYMVNNPRASLALRIQGTVGITIGVLLLSVVFDRVRLEWFLSLAALQAFSLAVGEVVIAKHQRNRAVSAWNYAAAVTAGIFACLYLVVRVKFAASLAYRDLSWLVYAYLLVLGIAQCLTAARMIYADYRTAARPGTLAV